MGRQMVGLRKGADAPADAAPDGNVVECPNCKCQFDPETQEVVHDGNGAKDGDYEGVDVLGNELSAPLNPAAAARGETAVADLLKGAR